MAARKTIEELQDDLNRRYGEYFETDPALSRDLILAFGQKLRASFYEKLPGFFEALRLIDRKELYPQHSDFFSRLAMTF